MTVASETGGDYDLNYSEDASTSEFAQSEIYVNRSCIKNSENATEILSNDQDG